MSKRRLKAIKPGMAIHCKTEDEAKELLWYLDEMGYAWINDQLLEDKTMWGTFKEETCYLVNENKKVTFGDLGSHKNILGVHAVEYTDLILPELTAEEVPEIIGEICKRNSKDGYDCERECPFAYHGMHCNLYRAENPEKTVEICTQWKVDHEKKAPELEWVDICQIIKKYPDGRKECVHEEDLTYEPGFQASVAQEVLGRYIAEHEGEYFAVMEAICRVKGERA